MSQTDAAADELRHWLDSGRDRVIPREIREPWDPPDWLAAALRFCVDRDAGVSLAQLLKPVPASYLTAQGVACLCGAVTHVAEDRTWTDCAGDCGRIFVADGSGVWAVRLPAVQPDEPAA